MGLANKMDDHCGMASTLMAVICITPAHYNMHTNSQEADTTA